MNSQKFTELCEQIDAARHRRSIPGVVFGISIDGERFVRGFGQANAGLGVAAEADTLVQIGSITKTFVGTLVMRLVEAGQLELDKTVRSLLPGFAVGDVEATERVTIRHLLTHLGGWDGDVFLDTGDGDDALDRYVGELGAAYQLAPLGEHYSYNNSGFSVLGKIIEQLTGEAFESALERWVLQPLGLERSFLRAKDVMTERFFVGHGGGSRPIPAWSLSRAVVPAGGIITDMNDLLAYGEFHCLPDSSLLSGESRRAMRVPHYDFPDRSVGLAWHLGQVGDVAVMTHSGGTVGQISELTIAPEKNVVFAFATNGFAGGELIKAVTPAVTDALVGARPSVPRAGENPLSNDLERYAGRYARGFGATEVAVLNGALVSQSTSTLRFPDQHAPAAPPEPPLRLEPTVDGDQLIIRGGVMDGRLIDAVPGEHGTIGWLRIGGRLSRRVS